MRGQNRLPTELKQSSSHSKQKGASLPPAPRRIIVHRLRGGVVAGTPPGFLKEACVNKFLDTLFKGVEILIACFLAVMIVLVFMNVVLRYVFSRGFAWSEEIARLCFIYLVYLGSIGAMRDNRHLLIDSILMRVPLIAQKIIYALVQVVIIWLMVILTRGSWGLVVQNLHDRWVATHFPTFLVYASGLVTGIAIGIIALANLYRLLILKISVPDLIAIRDDSEEFSAEVQ
jgi:TRAP-type C4-dicarboxylate transport system permease small subunit